MQANTAFQVKDTISDLQQEYRQFVADVRIGAPFKGTGDWKDQVAPQDILSPNGFMQNLEKLKYNSHEEAYARQGYGFLALVVSTFGVLGPTLIRYLAMLAL